MEILIKNIADIIDDKLSITQRGILITILLLKDADPKITLAKVKVKVKIREFKEDLVYLHKAGYIKWSGYRTALKSLEDKKVTPEIIEVIDFMNNLYKRKFKADGANTELKARLEENSVEDIKNVIANRWEAWKDEPVMKVHLHPSTVFRKSKFDKYLDEVRATGKGKSIVKVQEFNIKIGDELNKENTEILIDSDLYRIKTYRTDYNGFRYGTGIPSKKTGKAIKSLVKIQFNKSVRDGKREEVYTYDGL